MDALPNELQRMIASYLSREHLPNYRLVNKQCGNVGAQCLFDAFWCRPTTASLDRLKAILNNTQSDITRYIEAVDFIDEVIKDNEVLEDNEATSNDGVARFRIIKEAAEGFTKAGSPFVILCAQNLHYDVFTPQNFDSSFERSCMNLGRLDISLRNPQSMTDSMPHFLRTGGPTLRHFLSGLNNLADLAISLGNGDDSLRGRDCHLPHSLYRIIPLEHSPWPKMRRLTLNHMYAAESDLLLLLRSYENNLRCFHLEGLIDIPNHISPDQRDEYKNKAWKRIFQQMSKITHLEHGSVREVKPGYEVGDMKNQKIQGQNGPVEITTNLHQELFDQQETSSNSPY